MYLSRLILNPRNRRVQRELADPYRLHQRLMSAFPGDLKAGQERVLFRLEPPGRDGRLVLLVQSSNLPDWSCLAKPDTRHYLLPVGEPNPAVKEFKLDLVEGQLLSFRLCANPTVKRKFPSGDHKRVGINDEDKQIEWLRRKGQQGGFRLLSTRIGRQENVSGWAKREGKKHRLNLLAVQFDGLLEVVDPDRLQETVRQGIGSGKGFGFGLLSLASAPR